MSALLEVRRLRATYPRAHAAPIEAVAGVDLDVAAGEIVGVVGESGCGKSTLAASIAGVHRNRTGSIAFEGRELRGLGFRRRSRHERRLQMIFQNPYAAFNPRRRIRAQLADAIRFAEGRAESELSHFLERVGLPADAAGRYPHEFSGGQLQRLAIARALIARPTLIVADEPIAALDASAQLQIAGLLAEVVREDGVSVLLISHDLSVVSEITDTLAVMYLGRIVESGPTKDIWRDPAHPYTKALIEAIPFPSEVARLPKELPGEVPNPAAPPTGCRFHPRCPRVLARCSKEEPHSFDVGARRFAVCWLHESGFDKRTLPVERVVAR